MLVERGSYLDVVEIGLEVVLMGTVLEVVAGRRLVEGESKLVGVVRRQVVEVNRLEEVGRRLAVGD